MNTKGSVTLPAGTYFFGNVDIFRDGIGEPTCDAVYDSWCDLGCSDAEGFEGVENRVVYLRDIGLPGKPIDLAYGYVFDDDGDCSDMMRLSMYSADGEELECNVTSAMVGVVSVDQVVTACGRVGGEGEGITFTSSGPVEFDIPAHGVFRVKYDGKVATANVFAEVEDDDDGEEEE
jgi:hypothetical protein